MCELSQIAEILKIWFKKTRTNCSTVSLLWFVQVFFESDVRLTPSFWRSRYLPFSYYFFSHFLHTYLKDLKNCHTLHPYSNFSFLFFLSQRIQNSPKSSIFFFNCRTYEHFIWIDTMGFDDPDIDDNETFQDMLRYLHRQNLVRNFWFLFPLSLVLLLSSRQLF